ncbi:MAG: glycosyltransferase family 4 protein [Arenicella sp.]
MKIGIDIHTIGARQTGNETYIKNVISNMHSDHELHLYHTRANQESLPQWPAQYHQIKPHNPLLRIPLSFPMALRRDKIDVAHFQYVAPPLCHCPTVVMVHDISYEFFPEFFNPLARKRMQLLIPFSARKSSHVLTVSEYSKKQIVETYGIDEEKVTVTYNGVSDQFRQIDSDIELEKTLQRFALKSNPFILAVGNLQPRKNIERLIRVYCKLRQSEKITQKLVLVGKLDYRGHAIEQQINSSGMQNDIITTGYVSDDELISLYNRADFFVYPSYYEGFGLPVIEAMACGTAVITSRVSSIPEVGGEAALYIDPHSDDDLQQQILCIANDANLRSSLVEQGLIQAKKFNWETTATQTLNILEKVCK